MILGRRGRPSAGVGAVVFVLVSLAVACGGSGDGSGDPPGSSGGAAGGGGGGGGAAACPDACSVVAPADVKTATGIDATTAPGPKGLDECLYRTAATASPATTVATLEIMCGTGMLDGYDALKNVLATAPYTDMTEVSGLGVKAIRASLDTPAFETGGTPMVGVYLGVYVDDARYFMISVAGPAADEAAVADQASALARAALGRLP